MQDWREWREEAGDAVSELFECLKKVKREDIVHKICSKFREGMDYNLSTFVSIKHRSL